MFFARAGEYPAAGMYGAGHLVLFLIAAAAVAAGLYAARRMEEGDVRRTVRVVTAVLWTLEIVKICFVLFHLKETHPNSFMPLYYCSLILYAGVLSSLGRGRVRHCGDVFIATAGLVGGAAYLLCPSTSLLRFPAFHFMSCHSFLLHGLMVFLALLLLWRGGMFRRLRAADVWYAAGVITVISVAAFTFNAVYDRVTDTSGANLMFISKDFPEVFPIHLAYTLTGPFFPVVSWAAQAFIPFFAVYGCVCLIRRIRARRSGVSQ